MAAYRRNRDDAVEQALEASPVYAPLMRYLARRLKGKTAETHDATEPVFSGTASALYQTLQQELTPDESRSWVAGNKLWGAVEQVNRALRKAGVEVNRKRSGKGQTYAVWVTPAYWQREADWQESGAELLSFNGKLTQRFLDGSKAQSD